MRQECSKCGMDAGDCKCKAKGEADTPLFKPEDTLRDIANAEQAKAAAAIAERRRADAELERRRAARKDNPCARAADILDILMLDGQIGVLGVGAEEDLYTVLGECWECMTRDEKARAFSVALARRLGGKTDSNLAAAFAMGYSAAGSTHEKEAPHECGRRVAVAVTVALTAGKTVLHTARAKRWMR